MHIVIAVVLSIGTIYSFDGSDNELKLANSIQLPVLQLIVFPLRFLFYLYSFNLFHWRAIKRAAAEWRCFRSCCGRENAPRVGQIQEAATAPSSHRVTAPSVTFFDVPITGAFTDVTTDHEEQQTLLQNGGGGTEYGRVTSAVLRKFRICLKDHYMVLSHEFDVLRVFRFCSNH